jgi:hypothetical protein
MWQMVAGFKLRKYAKIREALNEVTRIMGDLPPPRALPFVIFEAAA